jgi:hypothetical protein
MIKIKIQDDKILKEIFFLEKEEFLLTLREN